MRRHQEREMRPLVPILEVPPPHLENPFKVVESNFGFSCWINSQEVIGTRLLQHGFFEPWESYLIKSLVKKDQLFLDIGANFGYFSMLVAACCKAKVLAFEPQPNIFHLLKRNITLNKCSDRVSAYPIALGNESTTGRLGVATDSAASSFTRTQDGKNKPNRWSWESDIQVSVEPLDTWLAAHQIDTIDFMKVDVEGYEPLVFEGARDLFAGSRPPIVLAELHPGHLARIDKTVDSVLSFFRSNCYHIFDLQGYACREIENGENNLSYNLLMLHDKHEEQREIVAKWSIVDAVSILNKGQLQDCLDYLERIDL